jgi:multiple sugar transport system ATP-binding protein
MNFMPGTLEDSMLRTSVGDFRLSDRMRRLVESSGSGRDVIVGLRPENFEDAALVPADTRAHGITFPVSVDVLESMGSDVYVYFTKDIEQGVNAAELEELARDSGRADTGGSGDTVVARLDAATGIREGQQAELWVDARAMHIFDPSTGRNLSLGTGEEAGAGPAPVTSGGAAASGGEAAAGAVADDAGTGGAVLDDAEPASPASGEAAPGGEAT